MIVPYSRFLERRIARHVLAAERRARAYRDTIDAIPIVTTGIVEDIAIGPSELVDEEPDHCRVI